MFITSGVTTTGNWSFNIRSWVTAITVKAIAPASLVTRTVSWAAVTVSGSIITARWDTITHSKIATSDYRVYIK